MKRFVLTIVSVLTLLVGAQAQQGERHMVVKHQDNSETKIPLSDVKNVTFSTLLPASKFTAKPFKVHDYKTVYFSPGNLQYQASTGQWRFADSQYDIIGEDNKNISPTYPGWIDLFGWGTANNPTNASAENSDYLTFTFTDWGARFGDGKTWYTLSHDEWEYLVNNHESKYITVAGVNGYVFLPDDATVSIDASWEDLEAAGAVFLPIAGFRDGTDFWPNIYVGSGDTDTYGNEVLWGAYWSSTPKDNEGAYNLFTSLSYLIPTYTSLNCCGFSVRLVRTAEQTKFAVTFNTDGGSDVSSQSVVPGETVTRPQDPTKSGYAFDGWYLNGSEYDFSTPVTSDISLTARWLECYTVTFNSNGGTSVSSQSVVPGKTVTRPQDPTRSGYYFNGWYLNGSKYDFSKPVTSNVTLSAQWITSSFTAKPFSVSSTKKVYFSSGNLQYKASTKQWRFAPSQIEYVGEDNKNISTTYSGWIDLFGWGTGDNPTNSSKDFNSYCYFNDWGIYYRSSYTWFTLSKVEWQYLIDHHTNKVSKVNGVRGLVILPDGVSTAISGTYTAEDWSYLEKLGAVFLPAAGYRSGTSLYSLGSEGRYWSSTYVSEFSAKCLDFNASGATDWSPRYFGYSVRLVRKAN